LESVFTEADVDNNGKITWDEFSNAMRKHNLIESMGIGLSDASALFTLLDVDNSGEIEADEFVLGCFRIKTANRGIDMANLMYFNKRIAAWWADRLDDMDEALDSILDLLQSTALVPRGSVNSCLDRRSEQRVSFDLRHVVATWSDLQHVGDQKVHEILSSEARKQAVRCSDGVETGNGLSRRVKYMLGWASSN